MAQFLAWEKLENVLVLQSWLYMTIQVYPGKINLSPSLDSIRGSEDNGPKTFPSKIWIALMYFTHAKLIDVCITKNVISLAQTTFHNVFVELGWTFHFRVLGNTVGITWIIKAEIGKCTFV